MNTTCWRVDSGADAAHPFILEAAKRIRAGEVIAFPTETVYGLGADATSTAAVERIYAAKGRPSDNPLIVHIAHRSELASLAAAVSDTALRLASRFWPGPLTLVLPALPGAVSPKVTAGLSTVAVRMPAHPVALSLISAAGCPLAAPSANRSGRPSPTLARHVMEDLGGRIAGVLDGGPTGVGVESTVVEVTGDRVHILRPGGITPDQLREVAAEVILEDTVFSSGHAPKSPGMKYTHYAPQGMLQIVKADHPEEAIRWIQADTDAAAARGETTGILTVSEHAPRYRADLVVACGSLHDLEAAARDVYASLRRFDEAGINYITAEAYPEEGIGLALMNRLDKAAGHRVVRI